MLRWRTTHFLFLSFGAFLRRVKNKGALSEFIEGADPRTRPVNVPELSSEEKRIKTLVLDLDETLVTSSLSDIPSADLKVKVRDQQVHEVWMELKFIKKYLFVSVRFCKFLLYFVIRFKWVQIIWRISQSNSDQEYVLS